LTGSIKGLKTVQILFQRQERIHDLLGIMATSKADKLIHQLERKQEIILKALKNDNMETLREIKIDSLGKTIPNLNQAELLGSLARIMCEKDKSNGQVNVMA
jgi:hypothetical protein